MIKISKKEKGEVATKGFVMEGIQAVLDGMQRMFDIQNYKLDSMGNDIKEIKAEFTWMKDDINSLKADTPSQREFDELKKRVNKYHPAN